MIDTGEELPQVTLQDIGVASGKFLRALEGAVCAFTEAVRVRVGNKGALKERLNEVTEGMVHDAVAKRGGGNQPLFGLVDEEVGVGARAISMGAQGILQGQKIIFQAVFKGGDGWVSTLTFAGTAVG